MRALATDAAHALRSLRRAPGHAAGTVLTLACGCGVALPLIAAARAGLAWRPALEQPAFGRIEGGGAGGWTEVLRSPVELRLEGERAMLWVLLAAGLLVLAATCVNAGALVLTRASARRHERALRAALGAGPARLLAQGWAEGAVLAAAGCALGLALGMAALRILQSTWPAARALLADAPDRVSVALALGLPAAVVLLFTLAPARRAGRGDLHAHLTVGERATPGPYDAWVRRVLAVAQFTASMGLLVGAGVLVRGSVPDARAAGPGFDIHDTLTLRVDPPAALHARPAERARALDAALAAVRALPGVRAAALGSPDAWLNLGPVDDVTTFCRECHLGPIFTPVLHGATRNLAVSAGWFSTLRAPLLQGREIAPGDVGARVVVVNRAFAYLLFPGGEPLGKRIALLPHGPRYTVVGVVGDLSPRGTGTPMAPEPALYLPARRHPPRTAGLAVRAAGGDPRALAPAVEAAVRAVMPGARLSEVMTMEERLAAYDAPLRWFAAVLAAVAAAALLLSSAGVYAVVAYGVARRTREIGVRMALGALARQVVRHVVGGGLRLARTGTILGALMGFGVAQTLSMRFRGIPLFDAPTWLVVPMALAAVTLAASWIPARRAARVDPMVALRSD
ncbi:MAG: FtsX-like permease family protein [Longimicrobiaceae bacterium]